MRGSVIFFFSWSVAVRQPPTTIATKATANRVSVLLTLNIPQTEPVGSSVEDKHHGEQLAVALPPTNNSNKSKPNAY